MLTFKEFQKQNALRSTSRKGFGHSFSKTIRVNDSWDIEDFALALAGETGELCNKVKKFRRGDFSLNNEIKIDEMVEEAIDVITYADLFISCLNRDTEQELEIKFSKVSKRIGYKGD